MTSLHAGSRQHDDQRAVTIDSSSPTNVQSFCSDRRALQTWSCLFVFPSRLGSAQAALTRHVPEVFDFGHKNRSEKRSWMLSKSHRLAL